MRKFVSIKEPNQFGQQESKSCRKRHARQIPRVACGRSQDAQTSSHDKGSETSFLQISQCFLTNGTRLSVGIPNVEDNIVVGGWHDTIVLVRDTATSEQAQPISIVKDTLVNRTWVRGFGVLQSGLDVVQHSRIRAGFGQVAFLVVQNESVLYDVKRHDECLQARIEMKYSIQIDVPDLRTLTM
jgi:hypothetical protein